MLSGVFGSLLNITGYEQQTGGGGKKKAAPRGSKKNGSGRKFLAYEKLTLVELQAKAKKYKIKGFSGMSKTELIAALRKK